MHRKLVTVLLAAALTPGLSAVTASAKTIPAGRRRAQAAAMLMNRDNL